MDNEFYKQVSDYLLYKTNSIAKVKYPFIGDSNWDDFAQDTLIHVWIKSEKIDFGQNWKGYIKVIFYNRMKNFVRDSIGSKKSYEFKNPITINKTITYHGDLEQFYKYEPEIIEHRHESVAIDFFNTLTTTEKIVLLQKDEGLNVAAIALKLNWDYQFTIGIANKIKKKYKEFL